MIKRNVEDDLLRSLGEFPAVLIVGARQTGKSTLVKQIAKDRGYSYITFDDMRFLSAAKNNPIDFVRGLQKPVVLDEVQRVPEIFLAIKQDIDENRMPGRYLLTGSANPLLIPLVGGAFVGRLKIVNLFPLSQGEMEGKKEHFIDSIFDVNHVFKKIEYTEQNDLFKKIIVGGYPSVQNMSERSRDDWFASYITQLLQRDILDLANIAGITELPKILNILAARVANMLNVAELSRSAGIATTTLHRYLALLKAIFLVELQPAWSSNIGKRYVKSPKINIVDTGLISYLLGMSNERIATESKLMGGILESFVLSELTKQLGWSNLLVDTYYFRTNTGIEVDIVLQAKSGAMVGIEIKSSQTVTAADFKGLNYLNQEVDGKLVRGVVLYMGDEYIPFGKNMIALPISYLWNC